MGYDLHITRAEDWQQNEGREISPREWLEVVDRDVELALDPENGAYSVKLVDKAEGEEKQKGWFDWFEGNVFTTDPSPRSVGKALALAASLRAKVQGDDGEIYDRLEDWTERRD